MKLSVFVDLKNPPPWRRDPARHWGDTLERIEEAERLGAASVWVSEHHFFEDDHLPQPLTFAAAIAARTKTIRIGTAVMIVALRSALQVAEEAAVVDVLSDGRLSLGVGVGLGVGEYLAFDADIKSRYEVTANRVTQIRELLSTGVNPRPVQKEIPMWGGLFRA